MRIIAGTARGRRLLLPALEATRPLLEQARGALFNILQPRLQGATVFDGYAGSGAIGLEALSRGAASASFAEVAPEALQALEMNIEACGCTSRCRIQAMPVAAALQADPGAGGEAYDLIFLDPPFAEARTWGSSETDRAVMALSSRRLAPDGRLIFRLEKKVSRYPERWGDLILDQDRTYGRSRLCFYRHAEESSESDQAENYGN